jgi:hypothetical protein
MLPQQQVPPNGTVHQERSTLRCGECGYQAPSAGVLAFHIKVVHSYLAHFVCKECPFSTTKPEDLIGHVESAHKRVIDLARKTTTTTTRDALKNHAGVEREDRGNPVKARNTVIHRNEVVELKAEREDDAPAAAKIHSIFSLSALLMDDLGTNPSVGLFDNDYFDVILTNPANGFNDDDDECSSSFACGICGFRAALPKDLTTHMEDRHAHLDVKPIIAASPAHSVRSTLSDYSCLECNYRATSCDELACHVNDSHMSMDVKPVLDANSPSEDDDDAESVTQFECMECSFAATTYALLESHRSVKHRSSVELRETLEPRSQVSCAECGYKTRKPGQLAVHVKMVHRKLSVLTCSQCNYMTMKQTSLSRHMRDKHDKRFFTSAKRIPST